jgi:hypothetical protein
MQPEWRQAIIAINRQESYYSLMRPLSIIGRQIEWDNVDKTRELWTVSSAYFDNPVKADVADKIFQIHKPEIWQPGTGKLKSRLVIAYDFPGFDDCERLPIRALLAEFGPVFSSSINWMLAYALFLGYNDIAIEGCDMISDGEYGGQRDGLFFMRGIAFARGIKIKVPEGSGIYMPPVIYGVEV